MFGPMRSPRGQAVNPWRLVRVTAAADPGAGEYGLLDPTLADEPELPRAGLLGPVDSGEPAAMAGEELPIPPRRPRPPYRMRPGARRDDILSMPPYLSAADWYAFEHALRRSGMETETEIDTARKIFGYEGGMTPNRDNGATAGITRNFLKDAWDVDGSLPKDPGALTPDQAARAYRIYFDLALKDVDRERPLAGLRDPKAAGQMIDLLFMEGKPGGRLVQGAMNDLVRSLPDHVQHRLGVDEVVEDGDIGDVTYTRLGRLLNAGFGSRLRNDIADRALAYFGDRYKSGVPKSIEERMNQYR